MNENIIKVNVGGVEHELNVSKALDSGCLYQKITPESIKPGNVYIKRDKSVNPFMVVQVIYDNSFHPTGADRYQLVTTKLMINGGSKFFDNIHTKQEIVDYLKEMGMMYSGNIADKFRM